MESAPPASRSARDGWEPPIALPPLGGLILAAAGLALLPMPLNVAAAVGLATVVLTLTRPLLGLYLVMLSVSIQDLGAVSVGGIPLTATKVVVPLALAAWLALRLNRVGGRLAPAWLLLPYGLYVATLVGSTVSAIDQMAALTESSRWLQALGVFVMTLDLVRTRPALAGLVGALLAGGAAQAGLGLGQSVIGAGPASFALEGGFSRAYGTFGMPNSYAGYLEMTLPLALALSVWLGGRLLARRAGRSFSLAEVARWLAMTGLVLLLTAALVASFSRGAWLGTTVGLVMMIALASRRSFLAGTTVALVLATLLGLGGAAVVPAGLSDRLTSITDSLTYRDVRRMVITPENWAIAERLAMWEAGLAMFRARPVYGVGAGNYNVVYTRYNVPQFRHSQGHAHNYYIHVAAETGLLGLAAYGLVLVGAWVDAGRALRRVRAPGLRALVVGAVGVLAAVMTHHLFENLHVLNLNLHLFAVLALPALALRLAAADEAVQQSPARLPG